MKTAFLIASLIFSAHFAQAASPANCKDEAIKAIVDYANTLDKNFQINASQVNYLDGAMMGDGGFSYEYDIVSIPNNKGVFNAYEVRFTTDSVDMCDSKASQATITPLPNEM